ncbi:hypothetical protein [Actinobacillus vicugnae]|uniref:hypothetical protein n=1 Tax=Actinobacillus vicugnae TaxID=2573093 RepID=UPI00123FF412|nr:hypothetical protein [Actinobacillus vicugnae]
MSKLKFNESFLADVAEHKITVIENTDNAKIFRCAKPNEINQSFTVIYAANRVIITGDMGDYAFGRLVNPYEFFSQNESALSFDYLAEKCLAEDTNAHIRKFDSESAENIIRTNIEEYATELEECEQDALLMEFEDSIEFVDFSNQFEVEQWFVGISYDPLSDALNDICLDDFNVYSHHFKWCVQAIAWATREFNKVVSKK